MEDSEDLTISGQVGPLFTPNRRNLAVTPLGRYTVGEALPIEVLSRDRGHTRYFNRKYFTDRTISHQKTRRIKGESKYHRGTGVTEEIAI